MEVEERIFDLIDQIRGELQNLNLLDCMEEFHDLLDAAPFLREKGHDVLTDVLNSFKKTEEKLESSFFEHKPCLLDEGVEEMKSKAFRLLELLVDYDVYLRCDTTGDYKEMEVRGRRVSIVKDIKSMLEQYVTTEALSFLMKGEHSPRKNKQATLDIYKAWDFYRCAVFDYIVSSEHWDKQTREIFEDIVLSPTVDSVSSQLFVSACTLACVNVFDCQKFELLLNVYQKAENDEVKQRALIGWMLASTRVPNDLVASRYAGVIDEMCKEDDSVLADIAYVQRFLAVTVNCETASRNFSHEMMDKLFTKMTNKLKRKFSDQLDEELKSLCNLDDFEEDEEDYEQEDDMGFTKDEVVGVDGQGVDLLLPQFDKLRNIGDFFNHICNWFMPFWEWNPLVIETMNKVNQSVFKTMSLTAKFGSPADAYAFTLFANQNSKTISESIDLNNKSEDSETEEEEDLADEKSKGSENEDASGETDAEQERSFDIRKGYIRSLYRYYKFYDFKGKQFNVFANQTDACPGFVPLASPIFGASFNKLRIQIARFAVRNHAPVVAGLMLKDIDEDSLEIHYMKGLAAMEQGDDDLMGEAVKHFERMLQLRPGLKKAYSKLCECYQVLGDTDAFLECFDKLWEQKDSMSEVEQMDLMCNKLIVLYEAGRINEAISLAYYFDYNHPEFEFPAALLTYLLVIKEGSKPGGSFQKPRERVAEYFADEQTIFDKLEDYKEGEETDKLFASTLAMVLKSMERDKRAEALYNYVRGLLYVIDHDYLKATDAFLKYHSYCDANVDDRLYDLIQKDAAWLVNYGVSLNELMLIYNIVKLKYVETLNNIKQYVGK